MLILASRSPRRAELLRAAGIDFLIRTADIDETPRPNEPPRLYVTRLAREKAEAIDASTQDTILAADTTVVIDNEILAKPADAAEAIRMLTALSGREHEVITGICLRRADRILVDLAVTGVWFSKLTPAEIEAYVATGEPMDKAGAYAIQGLASRFIPRIEGSYSNVVGLPVALVWEHLGKLGL